MRWHAHYHTSGTGHIYHGRFKSFPVECEDYLYSVCRYVQRNPLRVNLMHRAEHWRWSSLWRRIHGDDQPRAFLSSWPAPMPNLPAGGLVPVRQQRVGQRRPAPAPRSGRAVSPARCSLAGMGPFVRSTGQVTAANRQAGTNQIANFLRGSLQA